MGLSRVSYLDSYGGSHLILNLYSRSELLSLNEELLSSKDKVQLLLLFSYMTYDLGNVHDIQ